MYEVKIYTGQAIGGDVLTTAATTKAISAVDSTQKLHEIQTSKFRTNEREVQQSSLCQGMLHDTQRKFATITEHHIPTKRFTGNFRRTSSYRYKKTRSHLEYAVQL
ncbi:hypothetical protein FHG87_025209 [Trinorchestia longiramus]|nr:hypothetical protein FHG87_025209 [Trinorchestia longiramus]